MRLLDGLIERAQLRYSVRYEERGFLSTLHRPY